MSIHIGNSEVVYGDSIIEKTTALQGEAQTQHETMKILLKAK